MSRKQFVILFCIFIGLVLASCDYNYEKKTKSSQLTNGNSSSQKESTKDPSSSKKSLGGVYSTILEAQCLTCHNSFSAQGGVSLSSLEEVRRWSDRIRYRTKIKGDMPPSGRLKIEELNALDLWLEQGAPVELGNDSWEVSDIPTFEEIKTRIFEKKCFDCHSGVHPEKNLNLENYDEARKSINLIYNQVLIEDKMPLEPYEKLTHKEKKLLSHWLIEGAPL